VPNTRSVCECAGAEPTEEERTQRIVAHVRRARELAELKLWREAQEELRAARALRASNLPVLQEFCWVSIQLGDVPAARDACGIARHEANTPSTRALAFAHLGMLAEVEGSRTDAARYYRESLQHQPDRAIERRLRRVTEGRER
jgi:tetratricopeptide (TPR) repeat protein